MTDAISSSFHDQAAEADEELVFDEFEDAMLPPSPLPVDMAEKPRRAPRRGRSAKQETAIEQDPATPAAVEPVQHGSASAAVAIAEEPAGTSAPNPLASGTHPAGSKPSILLFAIVALALLTSLFSLGGLIAVGRTLAKAQTSREEALAAQEQMAKVPALVARLDAASQRLDAAAAKLAVASPSGPPATLADVRQQIDLLKTQLNERQPAGIEQLATATQTGFSDMAQRMQHMSDQMAHQSQGPGKPAGPRPSQDQ